MGTSALERILARSGVGAVPSTVDGAVPPVRAQLPDTLDTADVYTPDTDWSDVKTYLGNLGKLFMADPAGPLPWMGYGPEFSRDVVNAARSKLSSAAERTIGAIADRSNDPSILKDDLTSAYKAIGEAVGGTFNAVSNPTTVLPGVIKGMLEMIVEPTLTAVTGQKIVADELMPATAEEVGQGIVTTGANVAAGGVYMKLGKGYSYIKAGEEVSKTYRYGQLAKNISREMGAQAAAGIVQEGMAHPDEFTMESIVNNIANPLVLVTSIGGGLARGRAATKTMRKDWDTKSPKINSEELADVPSAKQVAITIESTLKDATAAIDAVTRADNWIEAGILKLRNTKDGIFKIVDATVEEIKDIHAKYIGDILETKPPLNDNNPKIFVKKGIQYRFADDFDNLLYQSTDLNALSKSSGISVASLKDMRAQLDASISPRSGNKIQKQMFPDGSSVRFKDVAASRIPDVRNKPRVYVSKTGTMLATMRPLEKAMFETFEQIGFLPKERVLANGMEASIVKATKDGRIQVRNKSGKFQTVDIDQVSGTPDGGKTIWTRQTYTEDMVDKATEFVNRNARKGVTFSGLIQQWAAGKNWTPDQAIDFEKYVYQVVQDRAEKAFQQGTGPFADPLPYKALKMRDKFNSLLESERATMQDAALNKLDSNGYRVVDTGADYKLIDINGRNIGHFKTMDEIFEFAKRDFANMNVPELVPSAFPVNTSGGVLGRSKGMEWFANRYNDSGLKIRVELIRHGEGFSKAFRKADRLAEDIATKAGVPSWGPKIWHMFEQRMNGINAAEAGIFKPLVVGMNNVVKLASKVSMEAREQVTRMLEQRSFKELRRALSPDEVLGAEAIIPFIRDAGGMDIVLNAYRSWKFTKKDAYGKAFNIKNVDPKVRAAAEMIDGLIKQDLIQDDRFLRYIHGMLEGVDMTADEMIATLNWDKNTLALYKESQKLFKDGAGLFGISDQITGYAPWITKWEGINSVYNKVSGPDGSFIHELRRIGVTPESKRVLAVDRLAYSYVKSGIHHQSPTAAGVTSGKLLSEMTDMVRQLSEITMPDGSHIDVRPLETWIQNSRGIPDMWGASAQQFSDYAEQVLGKNIKGNLVDTSMDLITLAKLGGRPILGLRDMFTAYNLALLYGWKAAKDVMTITPAKMKRIDGIMAAGETPQFTPGEILSRTERSKLSGATDMAMKLSLQQQTYKAIAGNTYLHTWDEGIKAWNKVKGDIPKLIDELGDLLDSGSRASQDYFLETVARDPTAAFKFLAARNAKNIANNFGRINNPLGWQTGFGRAWGQLGSWSLNALTVLGESIVNSRSVGAAAGKIARVGTISAAGIYAGHEAGLKMYNWFVNPFTLIPSGGPLVQAYMDLASNAQMLFSNDPRDRGRAWANMTSTGSLITPTVLQDMARSYHMLTELGDGYGALMSAAGFRMTQEYLEGERLPVLNIPKEIIDAPGNLMDR